MDGVLILVLIGIFQFIGVILSRIDLLEPQPVRKDKVDQTG